MRFVLLVALLSVLAPAVWCQYSCPLIDYTQSIQPVPSSLLADSPAYQLSFVNRSPHLDLAFLDVHYAINNADTSNIRLLSAATRMATTESRPFPPFLLGDEDQLDYWFTYGVRALGLACDTHHFQVSGKDVREHAMSRQEAQTAGREKDTAKQAAKGTVPADKDSNKGRDTAEKQTAAVDETALSVTRTLPTLHEKNPTLIIPPLDVSDATPAAPAAPETSIDRPHTIDPIAPAVERMAEPLDLNAGVCPLLPFTQQLTRASSASDGLYTLAFHNQSPTLPLAFLDVHFAINAGPTANLRLFSDRTPAQPQNTQSAAAGMSNEARGLDGIAMVQGDSIEYSFTYGVKEAGGVDGKVRACNTEVYKVKINDTFK